MNLQADTLIKRNVKLPDRRTSVQLEAYVWQSIDAILSLESIKFSLLCAELDQRRKELKLASSIRLFALIYYRTLSNHFHDEIGDGNMLHSPKSDNFNCFLTSLQQFSQYAQHAKAPSLGKPTPLLSQIQRLPRLLSLAP